MSESHWGGRTQKGALLTVVVAVALMAGLIALFYWSPWEKPSEADWLSSYEAWSEGIEASLAADGATRASCESTFDEDVGDPPGERLVSAAAAAREGCGSLSPDGWQRAQSDVVRAIRDVHAAEVPPRRRPDFAVLAEPIAGREVDVYCWTAEGWAPFVGQYAALRADEEISLKGIADTTEARIDLEPGACRALQGYVRRNRPIALSFENFALAEALVVLSHQAEHLRSPSTPEPEVECYAVQHVRPFIRAAGWGTGYQEEIALHAWELGYTQLPPQLRTAQCRNGGPLDRHPSSSTWP